jgi:phage terminase large subunit
MSQKVVAQSRIREWRENPLKFVFDIFGVEPDHWQRDALEVCGGPLTPRRRLSMKACTGPGKSAVLAWIGWHRLACFASEGEHPKGAALSGEGRANLRDNLWAELAKWQQRSEFLKAAFVHNNSQIHAHHHPETWFLSARSYAKDADVEAVGRALAGLHSRFPFALLDETGDMPVTVGQKAGQIFTGGVVDGLIASAGNPTSTSGLLYHVATVERDLWTNITITADPDDPKRTPRVDIEHAREQIKLHGRDNPWVMATILGQFPRHGFNTLLSVEEVEAAMNRNCKQEDFEYAQKRLGIDAARFGDDPWVIFPRQGLKAFKPVEMRNPRSHEVAARVAKAKATWGSEVEFFDGTGGYAAGAVDSMIQAGHCPQEIHFSGKATDPRFYNKRSEMWFAMADWVKRSGCLPRLPGLIRELTAPKYTFKDGKFLLEEKDQIKKRLGFSPNNGDALALTFAMAEMPGSQSLPMGQVQHGVGKTTTEFDPYRD